MCSRELSGSAATLIRPRMAVTVPDIFSLSSSASVSQLSAGAANDCMTDTGTPASLPGVYTTRSAASRSILIRAPSWPHEARPLFHDSAWLAANSSGDFPFRLASSGLIQGRKSAGARSGNMSSRLVISPLGSMMMAGTPSMAASSRRSTQRPVFPLPVIPIQMAWVVRSRESYITRRSRSFFSLRLNSFPR